MFFNCSRLYEKVCFCVCFYYYNVAICNRAKRKVNNLQINVQWGTELNLELIIIRPSLLTSCTRLVISKLWEGSWPAVFVHSAHTNGAFVWQQRVITQLVVNKWVIDATHQRFEPPYLHILSTAIRKKLSSKYYESQTNWREQSNLLNFIW